MTPPEPCIHLNIKQYKEVPVPDKVTIRKKAVAFRIIIYIAVAKVVQYQAARKRNMFRP